MPAPTLSAVLIVQDEEHYLPDCLASLAGVAQEVVVLDGGSRDATVAIAQRAGARVHHRPFDHFGAQKQAALELATGEWVLAIDADERIPPALAREITRVVADPGAHAGYAIRRQMIYLGTPLKHGGAENDWVLRLARRSRARFTDAAVHERLVVEGSEGRLRETMDHLKYRTLAEHVATIDHYTTLAAGELRARGGRFASWHLLRIPAEIWARLVLRAGLLDGRAGIIHAAMAGFYTFLKYAKLYGQGAAVGAPGDAGEAGGERR
ncbi:MAG: glycosyltransferase family 2 protein [Gemmatimonadaceae bacterium]